MLNAAQLSRIDLNLLTLFSVVLEEAHVARAAARLNLTPSAVSHGLGRLRRLMHDPLFLKTPKGMVPTDRALQMAGPVADILRQVSGVLDAAKPFDAAMAERRFTIGAPDAILTVFLARLLDDLRTRASGIDIALRQVMPQQPGRPTDEMWHMPLAELESHALDVAVLPVAPPEPRFVHHPLFDEDFVVVMRRGHPLASDPSLEPFRAARHLIVSMIGDPYGFVDRDLARMGLSRRIVLTVPNFLLALAQVADTDLIATVPRRVALHHSARFDLAVCELPLASPRQRIHAVATRAAMADAGVRWIFDTLVSTVAGEALSRARPAKDGRRT